MFRYESKDPLNVLDPVVKDSIELLEKLEEISPGVLKEVLIERVKGGITQRQQDLLLSVLLRSSL